MYVKGLSPGERDLSYIQTIIANISFISDAIRPIEIKSLAHRKNLIYALFLCVNNSILTFLTSKTKENIYS